MNTGSTLLDEEFGELQDGGKTSVSCIGISNKRPQVVDIGSASGFGGCEVGSRFTLFAIVEKLSLEEVLNLEWDGVGGII